MIARYCFSLTVLGVLTLLAFAMPGVGQVIKNLPSPEAIANADHFKPPRLTVYASRLATQPDMTGAWAAMAPKGSGQGPTFDPANTVYPPQRPVGEAAFGPLPGTYIKDIPYNAEYQKKYLQLIQETTEGKSRDNFAACFPFGVPRMIGDSPVAIEILQTPDIMLWYANYGRTNRRIFLDGRPHSIEGDPSTGGLGPSYSGHSTGYWEGNTLVADTVNMIGGYFDETPAPFSDQLHMVERIRLIDADTLEDRMTFTDSVTMLSPWHVTRYFRRVKQTGPDSKKVARNYLTLGDRPCIPNVRMDENGFQIAILPQELDAAPSGTQNPGRHP